MVAGKSVLANASPKLRGYQLPILQNQILCTMAALQNSIAIPSAPIKSRHRAFEIPRNTLHKKMKRSQIKPAITIGAVVLLIIVILQNMVTIETRILFFTLSMPRAVLLFLFAAIGFALGLYHATYGKNRRNASRDKPPES